MQSLTHTLALAGLLAVMSCAGRKAGPAAPTRAPAAPLPTAGLAGQPVAVYPLTMLIPEESLGWGGQFVPRRTALDRADSVIAEALKTRSPEVPWAMPDLMRRGARQAPGMLVDPDQLATSLLRAPNIDRLPDPLWSQMRTLSAMAGARFALVPASLLYFKTPDGLGRAELTLLLADVRTGIIGWRTVARGEGTDPWIALGLALKQLTPGLP